MSLVALFDIEFDGEETIEVSRVEKPVARYTVSTAFFDGVASKGDYLDNPLLAVRFLKLHRSPVCLLCDLRMSILSFV